MNIRISTIFQNCLYRKASKTFACQGLTHPNKQIEQLQYKLTTKELWDSNSQNFCENEMNFWKSNSKMDSH